MLSWFRSPKGKTGELDEPAHAPAQATPDTARTPSEQDEVFDDPTTDDPELIQTPAVAGTPHDVALAGVNARLQQLDELNRGRKRQGTVDTISDGTSQFHSMAGDSAVDTPRHSAAFNEPAYDPFTGKHTGAYAPIEIGFEQTNDLIWTQLASIRDQQTELALLHERMERKHGEEKPVAVDDTAELEEDFFQSQGSATDGSRQKQEARMREQQFSQLAQRFQERKRDIDMVMGKLHTLANTVKEFHEMPAPSIRFPPTTGTTGSPARQLSPAPTPPRVERPAVVTHGLFRPDGGPGLLHDSPSSSLVSSPIITPRR